MVVDHPFASFNLITFFLGFNVDFDRVINISSSPFVLPGFQYFLFQVVWVQDKGSEDLQVFEPRISPLFLFRSSDLYSSVGRFRGEVGSDRESVVEDKPNFSICNGGIDIPPVVLVLANTEGSPCSVVSVRSVEGKKKEDNFATHITKIVDSFVQIKTLQRLRLANLSRVVSLLIFELSSNCLRFDPFNRTVRTMPPWP